MKNMILIGAQTSQYLFADFLLKKYETVYFPVMKSCF